MKRINGQQPPEMRLEAKRTTVLVGPNGMLDSLGVISLIVEIEQEIKGITGVAVQLLREGDAMDESSPLHTVGSLISFLSTDAGRSWLYGNAAFDF